ncbi:hypothetical protein BB561_004368 [Smittium simulii]|uniref:Cytochrome c oxidase assembly protein COX16, mitochondrial n=1 Tax=Smittium simulii TaxID=133385 RepID=A0A2T9YGL5_9FUNG|nr:hypothetical protein BB561_004368 [Smittium simulii]
MFNKYFKNHHREINLNKLAKKYPAVFVGLPFFAATLAGMWLLVPLQQIRYDHNSKSNKVNKEELKLLQDSKRRVFNINEEYFKMQEQGTWDDYNIKRVERPPEDEPVFD